MLLPEPCENMFINCTQTHAPLCAHMPVLDTCTHVCLNFVCAHRALEHASCSWNLPKIYLLRCVHTLHMWTRASSPRPEGAEPGQAFLVMWGWELLVCRPAFI
jgi:hypothetical protein